MSHETNGHGPNDGTETPVDARADRGCSEPNRTAITGDADRDDSRTQRGRTPSTGRRGILVGLAGLVSGAATVGSASAFDHDSDAPLPEIEGPIEGGSQTGGPQTAAVHDLDPYGYTEEEYFFSGTAREDTYFGPFGWFADEADYKTRALVYRPSDPDDFNGHLLVDWSNVSTGIDMPVTWINAYDYLMREGYAVAAVSAQEVGVDAEPPFDGIVTPEGENLVSWDPERYGESHHPGDDFALDIFSQVVEGLRHGGEDDSGSPWDDGVTDPLDGLEVEYALATGQSQSAGYMAQLLEDVQEEYGNIDGYLPATSAVTDPRDDLVPVVWLNSEDEAGGLFGGIGSEPPADSGQFRLWEVAGGSHVNYWLSSWNAAIVARDFEGEDPDWDPGAAGNFGEREDGEYGDCQGNHFPMRHAYRAALEALRTWVEDGTAPDSTARIEREDGEVVTDEYGNAVGGVRLPPIDVPVAEYDARSCDLEGQTVRFDAGTLADLYGSTDDYVDAFAAAADEAVANGHLLPEDADDLVARAETVTVDDGDWPS
ncbi:alpha/beta hydrolase domain-containing protein [Halopiger goleimassiliensis]|uniref:alpha/beta hydrolase domain-containing protein n=1 Tax=Halopiger goleimassiliensis TaxID=1293048 RepID=UPI000677F37C|nr:alpha/beta hydrolase domain-containing protein [Halopiger goleimassiliensis]